MSVPHRYATPEDLEAALQAYRAECVAAEQPVLLTGMVLHLGFRSKQSLYNQAAREDGVSADGPTWREVVELASLLFEHEHEKGLHKGGNAGGHIFGLKNAGLKKLAHLAEDGWSDKHEHEISGPDKGPIEVSDTERAKRIAALLSAAEKRKDESE